MTMEPTGTDGFAYGLGVATIGRLIGHPGGIPGFTSFSGHDPRTGANIAVLTNGDGNGSQDRSVMTLVDAIVDLLPGSGPDL